MKRRKYITHINKCGNKVFLQFIRRDKTSCTTQNVNISVSALRDLYKEIKRILKIRARSGKIISWVRFKRMCGHQVLDNICGLKQGNCDRNNCPDWRKLNDV